MQSWQPVSVTAKKTDTVRSAMMNMMNRHCGAIPLLRRGSAHWEGHLTRGLAAAFKGVGRILSPVQNQIIFDSFYSAVPNMYSISDP